MTDLLDRAIAYTRALPQEMQDEVARVLLMYVGHPETVIQLTPEEEADLAEAEADADRGEFATDDEGRAVFAKYAGEVSCGSLRLRSSSLRMLPTRLPSSPRKELRGSGLALRR